MTTKWQLGVKSEKRKTLYSALFAFSYSLLLVSVIQAASIVVPMNAARVYPNPWRSDLHENMTITFDNLSAASQVKLFTISAHEIRSLVADSRGVASWDRRNASGDSVASGIYLYLITDPQGNKTEGKLAIIK